MSQAACCTCAALLAGVPRLSSSSSSEKPLPDDRQLDCCGRTICGACVQRNPRFLSYCPYCQTSGRSPQSRRRLSSTRSSENEADTIKVASPDPPDPFSPPPPAYTPTPPSSPPAPPPPPPQAIDPSKLPQPAAPHQPAPGPPPTAYVIHHLRHPPDANPDTLTSLSLQYGLSPTVLRQHNNLPLGADYLLAARNTLLIPTTATTTSTSSTTDGSAQTILHSLSPHPVQDAAERERKILIRRWMVACKEPDYDAAVVYLEASGYDFVEARAHPLHPSHHPPQRQRHWLRPGGWGGISSSSSSHAAGRGGGKEGKAKKGG
ncbi:hypothetical protein C8A05DRAFT_40855 [Staphylotrichum tortipilum]|uniref:LysM domain-containing protein n=1 Tax=Staphylotrichum tortipilum TaxID=2831512 RepID=A0AAN6MTM0_9PEZI|nr:hypothetical protein C8A05DRAFT_40855 [Staphylotrichum longicolle]